MKHSYLLSSMFSLFIITFFALFILMMLGVQNFVTPDYYVDEDNYHLIDGIITDSHHYEGKLYLTIEVLQNEPLFGSSFYINQVNERIIKDNGFYNDIRIGDTIFITSALGYFGDGWDYPIIELRANDIIYLDYDIGLTNVIDEFKIAKKTFINTIIFISGVCIISGIMFIILLIIYIKK